MLGGALGPARRCAIGASAEARPVSPRARFRVGRASAHHGRHRVAGRGRHGMKLTIRPLTPDLWPALEDLFGDNGAVGGCWCMYWRIGRAYRKRPHEENRAAFR